MEKINNSQQKGLSGKVPGGMTSTNGGDEAPRCTPRNYWSPVFPESLQEARRSPLGSFIQRPRVQGLLLLSQGGF